MQLRVGLKGTDLINLDHKNVKVSSSGRLKIELTVAGQKSMAVSDVPGHLTFTALDNVLHVSGITGGAKRADAVAVNSSSGPLHVVITNSRGVAGASASYAGQLEVKAAGNSVRLVLLSDLESYVSGVLQSEIPASYKLAAIEAQAVLARTYGLNPRLNHESEGFTVCDSFLCCQAFIGVNRNLAPSQTTAISQTRGRILTYEGKPALALFSANAGGHTENYSNCFSDPVSNKFPDDPIPYLRGVPEGKLPPGFPSEQAMRALHNAAHVPTDDSWSPSFKWTVNFPADALEAHMHHVIDNVAKERQFAPFIKAPASHKFGHIDRFEISERGVSGCAMELKIHTSQGIWIVRKELTIRSVFANPDLKLKRLRSARMFFDYVRDANGLLSKVVIGGLGSGHGVGLQQNGAQGLALQGKTYEDILHHYYAGAEVSQV